MKILSLSAVALCAVTAAPVHAEVTQSGANGFEVTETVTVAASPEQAWPVVTAPRLWWNKEHTYSGDSANLSLDERPGGCFCEKLSNKGGIEHMRVVYIQPPQMIRMNGAIGPLQAEAANGIMSITLTKAADGTRITLSYVVGGYVRAGFDKLTPVVDRVLGLQLEGLKAVIEGRAAAPVAVETAPAAKLPAKPAAKPGVKAGGKPAARPAIKAEPLAEVGATISGLGDPVPPAEHPRPADQDSPR